MDRRALVLAALAAVLGPRASRAQPAKKIARIGFLTLSRRPESIDADFIGAFPRGMRDLGYVEGKNLVIEWRFADGNSERVPVLAAELVQLKVDVIVTFGAQAISAAHEATTTIPIVMGTSSDPVASGFVKTLARPGGNITGLSTVSSELGPKLLEMTLSMVPKLSRVAVLMNPSNSNHAAMLKSTQAAAQRASVKVLPVEASTPKEIENAFSKMTREKAGAVIGAADALFIQQARQIAEIAIKFRMPSVFGDRTFAKAGCLMSYGQNRADNLRLTATYVDKILKGAKPADLPVELPTKFELFINRKTAKALGITIPRSVLLRADQVIE